jgi:hypothetical protein
MRLFIGLILVWSLDFTIYLSSVIIFGISKYLSYDTIYPIVKPRWSGSEIPTFYIIKEGNYLFSN